MITAINVAYVGFIAKPKVREYTFVVKEGAEKPREFQLSIPNEAFLSRRARYQDAPDICSHRLQSELAGSANHPAKTHYSITDDELEQYRVAHSPKPRPSWMRRPGSES